MLGLFHEEFKSPLLMRIPIFMLVSLGRFFFIIDLCFIRSQASTSFQSPFCLNDGWSSINLFSSIIIIKSIAIEDRPKTRKSSLLVINAYLFIIPYSCHTHSILNISFMFSLGTGCPDQATDPHLSKSPNSPMLIVMFVFACFVDCDWW